VYIIQTNTSLDENNNPRDFQSLMYQINKQTWEEFKEYIISEGQDTEKLISGTMIGSTKPRNAKILKVLINDEYHLEVIISNYAGMKINSKYFMVTDNQFSNLIR
jgi:hypothetical protein